MNILHIIFLRLTTKRRLQKKSKCSSRSASPWVTWSKHHGPGCRGCSSPAAGQRSASQEGTWTGRSPWNGCTRGRKPASWDFDQNGAVPSSSLGQCRPTAGKAYTGLLGQITVLWCSQPTKLWKPTRNHDKTMKPPWKTMETNQKPWKIMKPPWKTMETSQKP